MPEKFTPMGDVSVLIRVHNERDNLGELFDRMQDQTVNPQIIVVDNESTDGTRQLAVARGMTVVDITDFSYPKALNLGVKEADGEYVASLSAHSYPIGNDMLAVGRAHFQRPEVAGVYGPAIPNRTRTDRLIGPFLNWDLRNAPGGVIYERTLKPGQFQATNNMARRTDLLKRPYDERYGAGGEDMAWAQGALGLGLTIVKDAAFAVNHSHELGPIGWLRQFREWGGLKGKPGEFDRGAIAYRRKRFGS